MAEQINLFDIGQEKLMFDKPLRLIELFAGYGSQALALKYLGVPFEHWRISEWAIKSIQAYKDMHFADDNVDYSANMTTDELVDWFDCGRISSDYNTPLTREQLIRIKKQLRVIYDNMMATRNIGSIISAHASDLGIIDTAHYTYLLTYSFPCQDLSNAGKQAGMRKGSGTRSGLLWEVERLLDECDELPQILLMENVPTVVGSANIDDFRNWILFLESKGYTSSYQILNAKDYGVPQNRERCFMVSWLGEHYYNFPDGWALEKRLKDVLEPEVDASYYLADATVATVDNYIAIPQATKQGYIECEIGGVVDMSYPNSKTRRGRVQEGGSVSPTLTTKSELYRFEPVICASRGRNPAKPTDRTAGLPTEQMIEVGGNTSNALTTVQKDNMVLEPTVRIRKLTPKECFRLMGVKDKDYERVAKHQSKSSLYHLAGDSIVVDVLMAIFKEML